LKPIVEVDEIISLVEEIVDTYSSKEQIELNDIKKLYYVFWGTMIAEWYYESKSGAPSYLKHLPKVLGVEQTLSENLTPEKAANFSKGKRIEELLREMNNYKIDSSWLP